MEKINKKIINFIIYYFLIFFVIPVILLGTSLIVNDFGWFLVYSVIVFPLTFLYCLWIFKKNFKFKTEDYKKYLYIIWSVFLFVYFISILYIYFSIGQMLDSILVF